MNYRDAQIKILSSISGIAEKSILDVASQYDGVQSFLRDQLNRLYAPLAGVKTEEWYSKIASLGLMGDVLRSFTKKCTENAVATEATITALITAAMTRSYYMSEYVHAFFVGQVDRTFLPKALVDACVTGKEESIRLVTENIIKRYGSLDAYIPKYGTLSKLIADRNTESLNAIYSAVDQAVRKGDSIKVLTGTIQDLFDTTKGKAARIAGTETLRTSSAGQFAYTQDLSSQGFKPEKEWIHVTTLSGDGRPSHMAYDGHRVGSSEKFTINGHSAMYPRGFDDPGENVNCRCTFINIINGIEPTLRTGTNPVTGEKEIFSFRSFDEWMSNNGIAA